jgi:hypothetical protein
MEFFYLFYFFLRTQSITTLVFHLHFPVFILNLNCSSLKLFFQFSYIYLAFLDLFSRFGYLSSYQTFKAQNRFVTCKDHLECSMKVQISTIKAAHVCRQPFITISQLLCRRTMLKLHIIGDSNVDRYLSIVKAAKEDPAIQETTFTRATNLVQLQDALVPATPDAPHPNLVLACLTNPITNHPFEDYNVLITHCNKTFSQIQAWIQEGRGAVPGTMRQVLVLVFYEFSFCVSFKVH